MQFTFLKILISIAYFISDMLHEKHLQARLNGKATPRARLAIFTCLLLTVYGLYQVGSIIQRMEYDLFGAAVEKQQIEETLTTMEELAGAYKVRADGLEKENAVINGQLMEANKLITRLNDENQSLENQLAALREKCGEMLERERQLQARLKVEMETKQRLREQAYLTYNMINSRLNGAH